MTTPNQSGYMESDTGMSGRQDAGGLGSQEEPPRGSGIGLILQKRESQAN